MPFPWHSPAMLIHTCHAMAQPFCDSAMSFVKVHVVDGNIQTASLLMVTTVMELRVVAGRSWTWAGRLQAVSGRLMLIHTYHAIHMLLSCRGQPWPCEVTFRTAWSRHTRQTAWHGGIKHSQSVYVCVCAQVCGYVCVVHAHRCVHCVHMQVCVLCTRAGVCCAPTQVCVCCAHAQVCVVHMHRCMCMHAGCACVCTCGCVNVRVCVHVRMRVCVCQILSRMSLQNGNKFTCYY
jgi:hypothetical protein